MERRKHVVFLCLILSQGAHSIEEYVTRLYEVFPLTRWVCGRISHDLALGFVIANVSLITFGLSCRVIPVRTGSQAGRGLMWLWTILELCNGSVQSVLALSRWTYFPGIGTTPLLLFFAGWLALLLTGNAGRPSVRSSLRHLR